MSIKISELPEATSVNPSDIIPIVQGGTTKKATAEQTSKRIIAVLSLGSVSVDNTFNITGINNSYTPKDITTMTAQYLNNEYCSYNSTNGRMTFLKPCSVILTITTQIRSSDGNSTSQTPTLAKGFGVRFFTSTGTNVDTITTAEQTIYPGYANLSGSYYTSIEQNNYFIPMAYARTLQSGVTVSSTSKVWGYGRTSIIVELLEPQAVSTRSINLTRGISGEEELTKGEADQLLTPVEDEKELKKDILDDKEELKKADIEDVDIKSENIESGDKLEDVSDEQTNKPTDI